MTTRLLLIVLLIMAAAGYVAVQHDRLQGAEQRAEDANKLATQLRADLDTAATTERVVTEFVDRVQIVRERGATLIKEIPIYVTTKADAACPVPAGFVRVHNAAAANLPVEPTTGDPDAAATGITLSAVAGTVADNYGTCHAIRQQLIALQASIAPKPRAQQHDQAQ
jgi:hypothetical protein